LSLDRPALLRSQIRALLKAAGGQNLRLMLPLVTEVREMRLVRNLIQREVELQTRFGHQMPNRLELGAMLEVPGLLFQLDELMAEADFVAVGSNDLYQFAFACDRGNANLSNRFSPVNKSFLRMLRQIQVKAEAHRTPLSLCGEMAGRPLSAMALLGLGYRSISMAPAGVGPIKAMVMALDAAELGNLLTSALDDPSNNTTMLELLTDFADRRGIPY